MMQQAQALQIRVVVLTPCGESVIRDPARPASAEGVVAMDEVRDPERHLLKVARSRVRGEPLVTGVVPGSEHVGEP